MKTQIKLTKDNVPKDQMTAEDKKVESDQSKSVFDNTDTEVNVPSVPRLNLSSIGSSSTGSLSPKSDKSGDSREKQIEPIFPLHIDTISIGLPIVFAKDFSGQSLNFSFALLT